ncbi:MAG: J domain-containing protein [Phycisphaerae bacterium]
MMRGDRDFDPHYRTLGVAIGATAEELQQAFRDLVRQTHPDLNPCAHDRRRFVEIVKAYRILREKIRHGDKAEAWGRCAQCGKYDDLFDPLGWGGACADCLLGETNRRRLLPAPLIVVAKHLAVFGLYGASLFFAVELLRTHSGQNGVFAVVCALGGLLMLAIEVVFCADDR